MFVYTNYKRACKLAHAHSDYLYWQYHYFWCVIKLHSMRGMGLVHGIHVRATLTWLICVTVLKIVKTLLSPQVMIGSFSAAPSFMYVYCRFTPVVYFGRLFLRHSNVYVDLTVQGRWGDHWWRVYARVWEHCSQGAGATAASVRLPHPLARRLLEKRQVIVRLR